MKFDKTAIKEYYGGLPTWAKGVVVVGGLFIVYAVGKKVIGIAFPSASKVRNQQLAKDITQEISRLRKTKTQTFNDSQYKVFANSIYEGMRYCVGDDYGGVEDTMKKMMNDLDVALLIQAYGFRRRACFGIDTGGTDDLFTSVKAELGNEWGGLTGYRVTNINNNWARKGINYRL
jgi:hypothetical protein